MAKAKKKTKKTKKTEGRRQKTGGKKKTSNVYETLRQKHESEQGRGGGSDDYWQPPAPKKKGQKTVSVVRLLSFEDAEGEESIFVRIAKWWDLAGTKGPVVAHPDKNSDPIYALKPYLERKDFKAVCEHFRIQFLVNLVVVSEDGKKVGDLKIGQFSSATYKQILEFFPGGDKADQVGMSKEPVSLSKGCDFKITRERTGPKPINTRYIVVPLKPSKCKVDVDPINLEDRVPDVDMDALNELAGLLETEYGIEEE